MHPADDLWRRRRTGAAVALAVLALYLGLRWPLLHGAGILDLANVDSAIIALMGKKMAEGRGFDIFCWGVRHMGPLSSIFTVAWAWVLSAIDFRQVWPFAVRLAAMTEVGLGIGLLAWAVGRIDRRAAAITALILAAGPPELYKVSVIPLGHEMAFLIAAAMMAIFTQHLTAPPGRGWLSSWHGCLLFGVLAGVGWWNNRTVSTAIGGVLIMAVLRSQLFARVRRAFDFKNRLLLRSPAGAKPLPGLIDAASFLLHWSGVILVGYDLLVRLELGLPSMPFLFGRLIDGILLIAVAHLLIALARIRPRHLAALRLAPAERNEAGRAIAWTAGFAIGYAPAFLANTLGWYPNAYSIGFGLHHGAAGIVDEARVHGPYLLRQMLALSTLPAAFLWGTALVVLLLAALVRHRRALVRYVTMDATPEWGPRALFVSVVLMSLAVAFLIHRGMRSRYMMPMYGPFFALLSLEALHWWDTRRRTLRAAVALGVGACLISMATASIIARETVYPKPNAQIVLDRVEKLDCRVSYLSVYNAYDYRLLTNERRAFVPYVGHDHSPDYTEVVLKLPGRRCFITDSGAVIALKTDLAPKRKGRYIPERWDYLK